AANRDERLDRPATPAGLLTDRPYRTLGGRDLVAGGTWLAVNDRGVVAGLTNRPLPDGPDPTKRSRGEIPLALTAAADATTAVAAFEKTHVPGTYNPCWVLVGDRTSLYVLDLTGDLDVRELPPGVHVLENAAYGEPSPKIDRVHRLLDDRFGPDDELSPSDDPFAAVLGDHVVTDPSRARPEVSACCVHAADYGTRSSLVVRVPADPARDPVVSSSDGPACRHDLVEVPFRD
ncbi:MAG TPA: NRDE family protein, partial [Acidimicrobiales bacterium]